MILASGDRFDSVTVVLRGTWKVLSSISQNLKPAPHECQVGEEEASMKE